MLTVQPLIMKFLSRAILLNFKACASHPFHNGFVGEYAR